MRCSALLVCIGLLAGCGDVLAPPDAPIVRGPVNVTIEPTTATMPVRSARSFTVKVDNGPGGVTWAVNGVAGGNAMVGTITANGTYTAPDRRPRPITVMITATSVDDPTKKADATVTLTSDGVLYVTQSNSRIDMFDGIRVRHGDVPPHRSIVGADTQLSFPLGAAIDVEKNLLYFSNLTSPSVVSFTGIATATGNIAPAGRFTSTPAFAQLENVEYDPQRKLLYVSGQQPDIHVFDAAAPLDGAQVPVRSFKESVFTQTSDRRTFLDVANDRLYQTANQSQVGRVFVFDNASTATGAVAATRTLTGTLTGLQCPWGVALDPQRDLLYVGDYCNNKVRVWANASTVTGDVAPARTITPSVGTSVYQLSLDPVTDTLAVQIGSLPAVYFYDAASTLDGTQPPTRSITGTMTKLTSTLGMYVDWDR